MGNQNALKHGLETNEAFEERRKLSRLLKTTREFLDEIS